VVICVCYNLNEDKINKALEKGIVPAKMYDHFECDAPCEVCMEMIEELFVENEQK
jgi:bacterioferritin-associated ferredoxin